MIASRRSPTAAAANPGNLGSPDPARPLLVRAGVAGLPPGRSAAAPTFHRALQRWPEQQQKWREGRLGPGRSAARPGSESQPGLLNIDREDIKVLLMPRTV